MRNDLRTQLLAITSQYARSSTRRSVAQLSASVLLYLTCHVTGLVLLRAGDVLATVPLMLLSGLFIVRLFIIQHDCGHRSFLRSRRANDALGFWLGLITMTPYQCWRRFHAQHHIHSGNLDRRGSGDINTITASEYRALSPWARFRYRLYRHPLVLLMIGPPLLFILRQRTTYQVPADWLAERRSVHLTNLGMVGLFALQSLWAGPMPLLIFTLASMSVASIVGVWLFYVQHQFPDAYWRREAEWESWRASMEGATYYELPTVLRWLTANIGLHHIHHLDARIPNYRLYECLRKHPEFANPPRLRLRESLSCLRLRLWDDRAKRMVPFSSASR
jgi:acyl-lipid omega-6 desaturase (Delta-12 desaturase)